MTKPHIVIDARLYGPKHTGIGRYVKNLLLALTQLPQFSQFRWTLIVYHDQLSEVSRDLETNYYLYPTTIRHYSLAEQLILPIILYRLHPQLVHFTHFNKPLLYFGNSIVTIHDLIKHFSTGVATTTKSAGIYWLKQLVYQILTHIVIKTNHLIVPSNFWRKYISQHYHLPPTRITTTYEAIDPNFTRNTTKVLPAKPYIIYTGNLYPHKNIGVILATLKLLPWLKLKIICARSVFTTRIRQQIAKFKLSSQVKFLGFVPDSKFRRIYSSALALVHPSFHEGFSLTGLEAMALNCPVISSNSSCLPEIYQQAVLYFDPNSVEELAAQIISLHHHPQLRRQLIKKGHLHIRRYSWHKTASQTLDVYQQCLK